jgi:hypothetical protein
MPAAAAGDFGGDDELWDDDFDPYTSPPDGDEAWLSDLPAELREEHLTGPWTGAGEVMAAGFLRHAGGRAGVGFAAGGAADQLAPGPVLAGLAAGAWAGGLAGLGESELAGVLCAWRRMASWAAAGEIAAVIALARRRAAQARERKNPNLIDHVGDELAAVPLESGDCTHQRQVPGYRPPRSLRHLIAVRQRTCGFPGCRRPATRCDDDHTIPYHRGGRTCECNIAPSRMR